MVFLWIIANDNVLGCHDRSEQTIHVVEFEARVNIVVIECSRFVAPSNVGDCMGLQVHGSIWFEFYFSDKAIFRVHKIQQ